MTYEKSLSLFRKSEAQLQKALQRLEAAYSGDLPADITTARTQALAFWRTAGAAWEEVEEQRRRYWEWRANEAHARLAEAVGPLLQEILTCRRRSGRLGLNLQPISIMQHLGNQSLPPLAMEMESIPAEPLESVVMDQAEEDL